MKSLDSEGLVVVLDAAASRAAMRAWCQKVGELLVGSVSSGSSQDQRAIGPPVLFRLVEDHVKLRVNQEENQMATQSWSRTLLL